MHEIPDDLRADIHLALDVGYDEGAIEAVLSEYPHFTRDEAVDLVEQVTKEKMMDPIEPIANAQNAVTGEKILIAVIDPRGGRQIVNMNPDSALPPLIQLRHAGYRWHDADGHEWSSVTIMDRVYWNHSLDCVCKGARPLTPGMEGVETEEPKCTVCGTQRNEHTDVRARMVGRVVGDVWHAYTMKS